MTHSIEINNLHLSVKGHEILKDVNLKVPSKRLTVILGPSGCGKTTLLKTLNRLTDYYPKVKREGTVTVEGIDIYDPAYDITDIRKRMSLLAQRPYPLPMSIFGNVAYGLRISGRRKKRFLEKRVEYYLRQASLWDEVKDRLHSPASSLSIGQQQRLCLARGLAVDPDIILADEPTSALDPISSRAIEEKFNELKKYYTIVMVTHGLSQAKRIADYVVFMYLGEIIDQGPAETFFNNPRHEITRQYLEGAFE